MQMTKSTCADIIIGSHDQEKSAERHYVRLCKNQFKKSQPRKKNKEPNRCCPILERQWEVGHEELGSLNPLCTCIWDLVPLEESTRLLKGPEESSSRPSTWPKRTPALTASLLPSQRNRSTARTLGRAAPSCSPWRRSATPWRLNSRKRWTLSACGKKLRKRVLGARENEARQGKLYIESPMQGLNVWAVLQLSRNHQKFRIDKHLSLWNHANQRAFFFHPEEGFKKNKKGKRKWKKRGEIKANHLPAVCRCSSLAPPTTYSRDRGWNESASPLLFESNPNFSSISSVNTWRERCSSPRGWRRRLPLP